MPATRTPSTGGRGGRRAGAGRKPGSLNAVSKAAREAAAAEGKLPHEILLDIARGYPIRTLTIDAAGNLVPHYEPVTPAQVAAAAKDAAPFYAPKISTVEMITGVTDEDLNAIIERAAAEAEVSLGIGGEGAQGPQSGGVPASNSRERRPLRRRG